MTRIAWLWCASSLVACGGIRTIVGNEAEADYTQQFRIQAKKLSRTSAPASWQLDFDKGVVDEIIALPERRVLVGLSDISGVRMSREFPSFGPYVLYDVAAKRERWRFAREGTYEEVDYAVLATDPVILFQRSTAEESSVAAIDLGSGRRRWEKSVARGTKLTISGGTLIAVDGDEVAAIDLTSGSERWSFDCGCGAPSVELHGDRLWIRGTITHVVNLADGKKLFTAHTGAPASGVPILALGDRSLAINDAGQAIALRANGEVERQTSLGGRPQAASCAGERCVVAVEANGAHRLIALEAGAVRWNRPLAGRVYSNLLVHGNELLFSDLTSLSVVDLESGASRLSLAMPKDPSRPIIDRVSVRGSRAVVVTEGGVVAFELAGGERSWTFERINPLFTVGGAMVRLSPQDAPNANPLRPNALFEYEIRRYDQIRETRALTEVERAGEQASLSGALLSSSINFAMSAATAGRIAAEKLDARARRLCARAELPMAIRSYERAVQRGYFVKPIDIHGDVRALGVLAVNLDTGEWIELATSPSVAFNTFRTFTHVALAEDGQLFSNGPGIDFKRWTIDKNGLDSALMTALLAYELGTLKWRAPAEYATQSFAARSRIK